MTASCRESLEVLCSWKQNAERQQAYWSPAFQHIGFELFFDDSFTNEIVIMKRSNLYQESDRHHFAVTRKRRQRASHSSTMDCRVTER